MAASLSLTQTTAFFPINPDEAAAAAAVAV